MLVATTLVLLLAGGVLEYRDLEGPKGYADVEVLAPVVAAFFAERDDGPDRAGR